MLWKKESDAKDAMYVDLFQLPSIDSHLKDYENLTEGIKLMTDVERNHAAELTLKYRLKGNQLFAEKKWADVTECYNKSMCFAEKGSEQMGLAYANRSSCFFNMKMYAKCLIDIENAKQNSYPSGKMAKLEQRMATCLSIMEKETDQSGVFEPTLDYKPNKMLPCLADVLKIEKNDKYGRHIVAKEDIDVGKTVMVDQSYFAETIKQKHRRCSICLRMAENLKPCNKCTFTLLCPKCDGNSLHDIECNINTHFGSFKFMSYRMVVIRSILLAMRTFDDVDQLIAIVEGMLQTDAIEVPESLSDSQSKYRAFFKLQSNPKVHGENDLPQKIYLIHQLLMGITDVVKFFHSEAQKRFLIHLIGHHVVVIKNWIQSDTHLVDVIGDGIEIFLEHRMSIAASYFNHSCAPNAYITTQNGINVCVVVRQVRKGEQLCVTYDPTKSMFDPKAERQKRLRDKFNFQCNCDRCERPQLELSSHKFNHQIQSDPSYHAFFDNIDLDNHDYQYILSLKSNGIRLLKRYKTAVWSIEIIRIIFILHSITMLEKERVSGPIMHQIN